MSKQQKKKFQIGSLWKGKHLPKAMKRKESMTKRRKFRLGITKPTWQGKHLPTEMKQKISRTKIRQYKEGKIKPPWKNRKPPFYRYWLGKKRSKETISKIKATKTERLALGIIKPSNKGRKLSKEWKKHLSEARVRFFKKPENRKRWSMMTSKIYSEKPKIKEIIRKRMIQRYKNHPYLKKEESRRKQIYYETHPEARKNLLAYWKKPERKVKAMHNLTVKSEGEKEIANLLYKNNIKPNYESIELNFPEMDPVPDFYPKGNYKTSHKTFHISNIFVEFYGGHPLAWKSKVKKNILYKKYHVPVMIITPAELQEENHDNLLREMVRLSQSPIAKGFKLERWKLERKTARNH